jgi:hypothetical protein
MRILDEEYVHSTLATRVRLQVFEQPEGGFLVLEEWNGTASPVFKTLGLFDTKQAALARVEARDAELRRQRFTRIATAA